MSEDLSFASWIWFLYMSYRQFTTSVDENMQKWSLYSAFVYIAHLVEWCRCTRDLYGSALLSGLCTANDKSGLSGRTISLPFLLMPWHLPSPGHQKPQHWLCWICGISTSRTFSAFQNNRKYKNTFISPNMNSAQQLLSYTLAMVQERMDSKTQSNIAI